MKVLSLIPTFRPLFVNPVSEKTFETYSADACGCHLKGDSVLNVAEEKSFHISGHLRGSKSTLRQKKFQGDAYGHHLLTESAFQPSGETLHISVNKEGGKGNPDRKKIFLSLTYRTLSPQKRNTQLQKFFRHGKKKASGRNRRLRLAI